MLNDSTKIKDKSNSNSSDEEVISQKKAPMKTAADVVNRIIWDGIIEKEHIVVGYLDRFVGIKECKFDEFDWGDIVLADLGALAIPEHRINYFKYKNQVIWDKNKRIDNVYGSTGSGITVLDVISKMSDIKSTPANIVEEEPANKVGRTDKAENKQQPNYFIAVPITNQALLKNLSMLKNDLVELNDIPEDLLLPDTSYHLTLITLRLDTENDTNKVKEYMRTTLKEDEKLVEMAKNSKLKIKGVGEFYNQVFFAKYLMKSDSSEEKDTLVVLRDKLMSDLKNMGINLAGNYYDFKPHLTIFKLKRPKNRGSNGKQDVESLVDEDLWNSYNNFSFGEQELNEIALCKMDDVFKSKSYPVEYRLEF
mgnify:CR=1 FL=1